MRPLPCNVVRLSEDKVEVVDADGGGDDDKQADAEEPDDGESLVEWQVRAVDGRQRQRPDEEVEQEHTDGVGIEYGCVLDTVAGGGGKVPVACDGSGAIAGLVSLIRSCKGFGVSYTYLH